MTLPSNAARRAGIPAAAWFSATSFHGSSAHRAPSAPTAAPVPAVHVDTRPRVDYVLPDRTVVALIHDHGEYAHATRSVQLAGGRIVNAIRADLLPQLEGTAARS